jgi:imidazolonepropionase-like amidohydrolase
MNLGMVVDGFHAIEHALPNAPVYADVRGLFAGSRTPAGPGTAYTPTLLVAYGGLGAENDFWQRSNPLDHPLMLKHWPRRELDAVGWRRGVLAKDGRWNYVQVAKDAAAMARAGVTVTAGAHGQLQGMGFHWEMWALGSEGAMTPLEVLRAASLSGATYLGLQGQLGSIESGKLADFVVLDKNPLEDVHHTDDISFVVKNGQIWR